MNDRPLQTECSLFVDLWASTGLLKTNRKQRAIRSLFRTVASGIIINFATPFENNANRVWTGQPECSFVGQTTRALLLRAAGPSGMIGIQFRPHGAAHLIEMPMHEMTDSVIALEHILQRLFRAQRVLRVGGIAKAWHLSVGSLRVR